MSDIFSGIRTIFNQYNLLGLGTDLVIFTIIGITILATSMKNKDKLLALTMMMGAMLSLELLVSPYAAFTGGVSVIMTVLSQVRE